MKIVIVTCYRHNDYIRAQTLRQALIKLDYVDVRIIRNRQIGLLRYPEVLFKMIWCRLSWWPDGWLLTFRGYESLPLLLLVAWPKPVIFDEMINLMEWTVDEHHKLAKDGLAAKLLALSYSFLLRHCWLILTDTVAHAAYSSTRSHVALDKYRVIPVGAIEHLPAISADRQPTKFQVLYYGSMLPLHGLDYVLQAAIKLKTNHNVNFLIIGGKNDVINAIKLAQKQSANINYIKRLDFQDLLVTTSQTNLGLGGPFGDTLQADMVITGKTYQFLAFNVATIIGQNQATGRFKNSVNCLLVPRADANQLAAMIDWAYHHQAKLKVIAKAGQKLYFDNYSIRCISRQLDQIMRQLA